MTNQAAGIDSRDKGQIPVSMGTSLAIEAALGIYPDRPESPPPIIKVQQVWFNIRTLIRNLYNSLTNDFRDQVTTEGLLLGVQEELSVIESAINRGSQGMARVVFYIPDYTSLHRKFPKAILRQTKSEKQLAYYAMENKVCAIILKSQDLAQDIRFYQFAITERHPDAFIVTHLPVDLLARHQFRRLELLESHSGGIKPYPMWHTKLTGGKELTNIPFNAFSLQLFGDNGNQFAPYPVGLRKQILQIAEEDRWTSVTTDEKIRYSLRKITHAFDRATLLGML